MSEIKEELYQSMLIGDLTISSGTSKEILEYIEKLENQLQQKENIIKEVREFAINNTVRGLYELLDKENK